MYVFGDKSKGATCLAAICAGIPRDEGDELYCELVHDGGISVNAVRGGENAASGVKVFISARGRESAPVEKLDAMVARRCGLNLTWEKM